MTERLFNPLDKINLARSIEHALLAQIPRSFSELNSVTGAGIYAIYYFGDFGCYGEISKLNASGDMRTPIYVGKAIPSGGRKGGIVQDSSVVISSKSLSERLSQHAQSIRETTNLKISDFSFRYLLIDDIWIPLGENMLIETFRPLWNQALDGFGNKDPGNRRALQYKSPWDTLHPGRRFAEKLAPLPTSIDDIKAKVADHIAKHVLARE